MNTLPSAGLICATPMLALRPKSGLTCAFRRHDVHVIALWSREPPSCHAYPRAHAERCAGLRVPTRYQGKSSRSSTLRQYLTKIDDRGFPSRRVKPAPFLAVMRKPRREDANPDRSRCFGKRLSILPHEIVCTTTFSRVSQPRKARHRPDSSYCAGCSAFVVRDKNVPMAWSYGPGNSAKLCSSLNILWPHAVNQAADASLSFSLRGYST